MKRFSIFFVLLIFLFVLAKNTLSQDFDYQKAFQDYDYSFGLYLKNIASYKFAKSQYLSLKTIESKNVLIDSVKVFLTSRNVAINAYLTALRFKVFETSGLISDEKNNIFGKIDPEVAWYLDNNKEIDALSALELLNTENKSIKTHYGKFSKNAIYRALFAISYGRVSDNETNIRLVRESIKEKIDKIDQNHDKNTQVTKSWLQEVDIRIDKIDSGLKNATQKMNSIDTLKWDPLDAYNQSMRIFDDSQKYVKEAISYFKQIVKELKTAD
ncbi:hypothetical protein A3D00_03680 [Candidatus Woesebacteria bacterium RIFCSPHIGHO2_02_FULL_38_9]|uniref:Uncharacterized protein n=1 Tax=Candidatus Woesebacteria bacterium RIFCSPHIGHO2_01_FULL_39_28 TaxID=1802496 RepID=A0A1F7YGX4_9BACT|nr:MAG: hypothetical protein A2627_01005 [Candidatus Woesebacteria bacterium RIFCSPHIGHO2_01_FULL_39_28]OGM32595.1 MAG: hypothetical protein A3D00_03680 [Candidatus Woesebacteria bacterium RIFCSPHIGHO2_02_FULL_38_9]OGM57715.1 MAG: hypothetical protein A3A50_01765 [Candidatus Woesebacteria bacterium RIFCSPLOWO2_01_FULL_38_20]